MSSDCRASQFQSTLPRRERPTEEYRVAQGKLFQSTLPRRERPAKMRHMKLYRHYFNPRSREGSDGMRFSVGCNGMGISIHAPAKGATFTAYYPANNALISIHAPAKGATSPLHSVLPVSKLFQSTLPRRERRMSTGGCGMAQKFQSTLPRRERRACGPQGWRHKPFQSTLPRRERQMR